MMSEKSDSCKMSIGSTADSVRSNAAPKTFEEFLQVHQLKDWPEPLTSEGPLDIGNNNLGFGTLEDIHRTLHEAAPTDYPGFEPLLERLEHLEELLHSYADRILKRPDAPKTCDDSKYAQPDSKKVRRISKLVSMADIKKKSVDFCTFPGYFKNELTELPNQLEAPQILHEVTKAQQFNSGFRKFWQKIFLSEASVAVMQDLFWWFFLEKFETKRTEEQMKLFDRIADSFVALFFSINPEVKDKFFQVYADCLAQAIFVAFYRSFPESTKRFDEQFIDNLLNLCVEWITGVKPIPESWRRWRMKRLVQQSKEDSKEKKISPPSTASAFHGDSMNLSLDLDGFTKLVSRLGTDRGRSLVHSTNLLVPSAKSNPSKQSFYKDTLKTTSHQMGPGPEFETVSFNTLGQSLLVSHFLQQRKLQGGKRPELKVKRTQISKLPELARQTYQEYINERLVKSDSLSRQYQRAIEENEEEIRKIQRKNLRTKREINQISRKVMFSKNPMEIKIMSEKILDLRERQAPSVSVNGKPMDEEGSDTDDALLF